MKNKRLPNASAVLVLGILSICFCAALGLPGLAMGIIALVLYKKDKSVYDTDPVAYEQSFKNSNAGKICAIVGLSLSAITFLMMSLYFILLGTLFAGVSGTVNEAIKYGRENQKEYRNYDKEILESYSTFYIDSTTLKLNDSIIRN
jgi:hypothetical protein